MKRLLLLFALLLVAGPLLAQTTNINLQVTDSGGQAWINGTWTVTLVTPPGIAPYGPPFFNLNTTTLVPNQTQSGVLSGTGSASMTLTQNAGVSPANSQWRFIVCPQASAVCLTQFVTITSVTTLTFTPSPPVVQTTVVEPIAYADAEVSAGVGQHYYNVISNLLRICQTSTGVLCSSWTSSGGGGGGTPGGVSGQLQYNYAGAFGGLTLAGDCTFSVPNITCTKTNGVVFAPSATIDTTNGSNITSGTVAAPRVATLNQNTTGNAATSTALAATPTQCTGVQFAIGVAANGNANCSTPSGTGNTTSTALTPNVIPKANGANSIVNSALDDGVTTPNTLTYGGTGGDSAVGYTATGSGAGFFAFAQGADNCVAKQPAGSVCWEAPASGVTSYHGLFAVTPSTGIPHYVYVAPTITETISAITPGDATGNTSGSGNFCLTTNCGMTTPNLGTPSAVNLSNATNLPCAAMPALTGDATSGATSCTTTVVQVEGAVIPVSAHVIGTNASKQLVASTAHDISVPLACVAASGSGTAYTCTTAPTFAPADGDVIQFEADVANTGAATLNVNASSAAAINKQGGGTALIANDLLAGQNVLMVYDGVHWQMQGQTGNPSGCFGTLNILLKGAGVGVCPTSSSVTDDGTTVSTSEPIASNDSVSTGGLTKKPYCTGAGASCFGGTEGTIVTTDTTASTFKFLVDSAAHEAKLATNATNNYGMLNRSQPGAINSADLTAAVSTATLCAAAAGACNISGQYEVHFDFIETGTACGTPGTGGVTFLLTWTDANGTVHTAVSLGMDDASAINAVSQTFHFQTSLGAAWASGQFTLSSNGSVIQYATGYTACGVGTGTYRVQASVVRLQ